MQPEMGGDGLLLVMEALGSVKGHWTANGVDVNVYLEKDAMIRVSNFSLKGISHNL